MKFMGSMLICGTIWLGASTLVYSNEDSTVPSALTTARNLFKKGLMTEAKIAYDKIEISDVEWREKAEDGLRMQLIAHRPLAAWRIAQLMARVDNRPPLHLLYSKLSAILAGGCSLGTAVEPYSFNDLINAFSARFYQKFLSEAAELVSPMDQADRDVDITYLNFSQVPFLDDLGETKILRARGCRFRHNQWSDREHAEVSESFFLASYLERVRRGQSEPLPNQNRIKIRLLELDTRQDHTERGQRLLSELAPIKITDWLQYSPEERIFLWSALQENKKVPVWPQFIVAHSLEEQLVEALILASDEKYVTQWLALADFDRWSVPKRQQLFAAIDKLREFPGKEGIILRRALLAFESGNAKDALMYLRRILINHEGFQTTGEAQNNADSIYAKSLHLLSNVLKSYEYDRTVLSAIQTAAPGAEWQKIYLKIMMEYALGGDQKSYERLKKELLNPTSGKSSRRVSPQLTSILDAMATRNLSRIMQVLSTWQSTRGSELKKTIGDLALIVSGFDDADYQVAKVVLQPIADFLSNSKENGRDQTQLFDLVHTFLRTPQSIQTTVSSGIQGGVTHAGVTDLRSYSRMTNEFTWHPSDQLPLEQLLPMPASAVDRSWVIQ